MTGEPPTAPGWPGISPRWTSSAKSAVGTALSGASPVWFTLSHGIVNEVYYPRLGQACTRDLGLIVTDGDAFFSEEKRDARPEIHELVAGAPACRLVNRCRAGRYRIEKEVLTDPRRPVLLQRTRFLPAQGTRPRAAGAEPGRRGSRGAGRGGRLLFAERAARDPYLAGWSDWQRRLFPLAAPGGDDALYRTSMAVLRTHAAKSLPGGIIASLSIPWGFAKGDEDLGGYHLVWPRDLVVNHKCRAVPSGTTLRIEVLAPAVVHWSLDDWVSAQDTATRDSGLGIHVADLPTDRLMPASAIRFTFYWPEAGRWEGENIAVGVE